MIGILAYNFKKGAALDYTDNVIRSLDNKDAGVFRSVISDLIRNADVFKWIAQNVLSKTQVGTADMTTHTLNEDDSILSDPGAIIGWMQVHDCQGLGAGATCNLNQ